MPRQRPTSHSLRSWPVRLSLSLSLISFYSSYVISICAILLLCLGAETERNVEEDEEINMSN